MDEVGSKVPRIVQFFTSETVTAAATDGEISPHARSCTGGVELEPSGGRVDAYARRPMVIGLAFLATAVATLFVQATLARATTFRRPQDRAWTIALALFALASAALATGVSTGWDNGTFRVFYLLGAILSVPWLALGTVYLLTPLRVGRRVERVLVFASGLATGVLLTAPMEPVQGTAIPVGKDVFGVFPRVLAAVASGVGATVIIVGALVSAWRFAQDRGAPGHARRALANVLIALGTLVLSSGGLIQGIAGKDQAFVASLALGISVIYSGFLVAASARARLATVEPTDGDRADGEAQAGSSSRRRSNLPA